MFLYRDREHIVMSKVYKCIPIRNAYNTEHTCGLGSFYASAPLSPAGAAEAWLWLWRESRLKRENGRGGEMTEED